MKIIIQMYLNWELAINVIILNKWTYVTSGFRINNILVYAYADENSEKCYINKHKNTYIVFYRHK